MAKVFNSDRTFWPVVGQVNTQVEYAVIGWGWRDGYKQLLTNTGFTLHLSSPEETNALVDQCIKERLEANEYFPEFMWTGKRWKEVHTM